MGILFEHRSMAKEAACLIDKPLVSVVMTSYQQKELSSIALKSLLKQDYDNLEIVIADDCSQDGSPEHLLELCKNYSIEVGKHSIIFNLNESNLGVTRNYELGFKLSHGELIVAMGGDDISYPNRVSRIVEKWLEGGRNATVIYHKLRPVDIAGKPLGYDWWQLTVRNPLGAAMAYSRVVIDKFPEISISGGFEDSIFARRAFLFGEQLFMDDVLIDYRIGSGVTSSGDTRAKRMKISRGMVASTVQNRIDIEHVRASIPEAKVKELEYLVDEVANTYGLENQMIESSCGISRMKSFISYVNAPNRLFPLTPANLLKHYIPLMYPHLGAISFLAYRLICSGWLHFSNLKRNTIRG